jgi:hypothetical protein
MNEYRQRLLNEHCITLFEEQLTQYRWYIICRNTRLSKEFIREFYDKLDWGTICMFQTLSDETIFEFKNNINFNTYFIHKTVEYKIIKRYISKTYFRNVENFKSEHLTDFQKQVIQKMLDLKYLFNSKII